MANKANFVKAHTLVNLGLTAVLAYDSKGRAKSILVPGSDGKQYEVVLRRNGHEISTECRQIVGKQGHADCKGNSNSLCYHSLAAVVAAAEACGQNVSFSNSDKNARKSGGAIVRVISYQSGKNSVFVSVKGN